MHDFMDDCIHLKACRRCKKMYNGRGGRNCTESCSAYISGDDETIAEISEVIDYARRGAEECRRGYDPFDVFVPWEIPQTKLGDYINAIYER